MTHAEIKKELSSLVETRIAVDKTFRTLWIRNLTIGLINEDDPGVYVAWPLVGCDEYAHAQTFSDCDEAHSYIVDCFAWVSFKAGLAPVQAGGGQRR